MEDQYLKAFINEVNNDRQIYDTSFSQLYEFGIIVYTENLKSEILKNLLVLDKKIYIEYVEGKLNILPCMSIIGNSIDKWISKFKILNSNFPYFDLNELTSILKTCVNRFDVGLDDNDEIIDREELISLQIDFYLYASMLETKKILKFIDSLKVNFTNVEENLQDNIDYNKESLEDDVNYHRIFKSIEASKLFKSLTEYLEISKIDISKRGVQAKFNGIWGCPLSRDKIFNNSTLLEDYVKFLNREFKTTYNSRSMSDGTNYHNSIKEYIKI